MSPYFFKITRSSWFLAQHGLLQSSQALSLFLFLFLTLSTLVYSSHDDDRSETSKNNGIRSLCNKPLILVKISCTVFFLGTFAARMSPYFLKWNEGFLVLGSQFAGGIFLGTALMHFSD
ncbi:hypothetical protein ACFX13_031094 [Malus domestica]